MREHDQHELLLRGLVGERLELYTNSAYFHDAVTRLAYSLPALVEALAAKAELVEQEHRATYGNLTAASWPTTSLRIDP